MSKKLYIGNLPWSIDDEGLKEAFAAYGTIEDSFVMKDRYSGRSKGFGFVTFSSEEEAAAAVEAMNGKELDGRALTVDFARPKTEGGGDRF